MQEDQNSPIPPAQTVFQPVVFSAEIPVQPATKPRRSKLVPILVCLFLVFAGVGYVGFKSLQKTSPGTASDSYTTYSGNGKVSFEYPKDWTLKEEDTTSKEYGAYKITVSTPDYTSELRDEIYAEITTKGYRFTVYYSKSDGIIENTDAMFKYLSDERVTGLRKLETPKGIVLVQSVGQPSALIDYSHNSSTQSFFAKDQYDYYLSYDYPDRKDFVADETNLKQYEHLLSTFEVKK